MAPPLLAGAVNATVADVGPVAVTVPTVGVPGTVAGVMLLLEPLAGPVPCALVATTVNV